MIVKCILIHKDESTGIFQGIEKIDIEANINIIQEKEEQEQEAKVENKKKEEDVINHMQKVNQEVLK